MKIDPRKIQEKFADDNPYLVKINELTKLTQTGFANNLDDTLRGERLFEIIAQIIIDVCTHISSSAGLGTPKPMLNELINLKNLPYSRKLKLRALKI